MWLLSARSQLSLSTSGPQFCSIPTLTLLFRLRRGEEGGQGRGQRFKV